MKLWKRINNLQGLEGVLYVNDVGASGILRAKEVQKEHSPASPIPDHKSSPATTT
jgi:hypothetical protein